MAPKLAKMSVFFRSKSALPSEASSKEEEEVDDDVVEGTFGVFLALPPCSMLSRFSTVMESEKAVDGREGGGMNSPPGIVFLRLVFFEKNVK